MLLVKFSPTAVERMAHYVAIHDPMSGDWDMFAPHVHEAYRNIARAVLRLLLPPGYTATDIALRLYAPNDMCNHIETILNGKWDETEKNNE